MTTTLKKWRLPICSRGQTGLLVVGFLAFFFLGVGGVNAEYTEIDPESLILQMNFTNIEDLAGKQSVSLQGMNYSVTNGICGSSNRCYNVGYTNNGINLGAPLLTDNTNRTIAFDGYIISGSNSFVSFVSQYNASSNSKFYIGKHNDDKYIIKVGASNNESSNNFTGRNIWQHWVISKNGTHYVMTVDGMELINTTIATPIMNTVNTVIGLNETPTNIGYIDNLFIFNEVYDYAVVREYIESLPTDLLPEVNDDQIDENSLILQMDFTDIEDLTHQQNVSLQGRDYSVVGEVCGENNSCYNIRYPNNGIDIGSPLLSDNFSWTIAFDGYVASGANGIAGYAGFISQYIGGNAGRFFVGKSNANQLAFRIGNQYTSSPTTFTTRDTRQHYVLTKQGNLYDFTVDGIKIANINIAEPILNTVNTLIGGSFNDTTGYIDNLYIFNEAYSYEVTREYIENNSEQTPHLSVTSPTNYQLYQRDETNKATIIISGAISNLTGTNPVHIEMSYKGSPWTTIATTTGKFYYEYLTGIGMGELTLRISEYTGVAKKLTTGIGDLYLLIGQSNQDGRANTKNNAIAVNDVIGVMFQQTDRCSYYITSNPVLGSRKINNDPTGNGNAGGCGNGGSQRPLVANQLIANTGVPIGWIAGTYGGVSITTFQKGQGNYDRALQLVNQATNGTNKIKGILWHQGENDSAKTKDRYYNQLNTMINSLQNDLTFEKIMIAIVSTSESGYGGGNTDGPQQAQYQIIDDLDRAVQGPDSYDITTSVDDLHYKTDAEIGEFARRRAKHLEKQFYEATFEYPEILGYYKYDNNVVALVLNQEAEVSNFLFTTGNKAEGFTIVNSGTIIAGGATENYTTSFIEENGRYLLLIDIGEEVDENNLQMTYAKTNAGYNKNVLRSTATKLSFNRNFDMQKIIPLTISDPTLTTSKNYDGNTSAKVTAGVPTGVREGDDVSVIATANYDTATVGTNKIITVIYTLTGTDAYKYFPPVDYVVTNGEIISINNGGNNNGGGSSGGGGGGSSVSRDNCPNGDFSPSYYDRTCGNSKITDDSDKITGDGNKNSTETEDDTAQSSEILGAYQRAYTHNITTLTPLENAYPQGIVIREHLAKMVVNYALNALGWTLPEKIPSECHRKDDANAWESQGIKDYAVKACQLGLMGMDMEYFQPYEKVSRAQFGTVLSRLLRKNTYAGGNPYYTKHLQALKEFGIMTQIDTPEARTELRQWVWLMLMRSAK